MENQQQDEQLTAEQLEARRLEMKNFYESSIPYLESQAKYEKLLTDVEESRYKRATMQFQYANMMAAQQEMEGEMGYVDRICQLACYCRFAFLNILDS
jgi:hypothetical protein